MGATLYVSLEPCAHYGKTAPCVDAIIKAGIKEVVIAIIDPNPITSGKGMRKLQDAGIDVKLGVMESQAAKLNDTGGLPINNALTIYPYSDVETLLKKESAGGDKAPLPGPGDKPCTERPDKKS